MNQCTLRLIVVRGILDVYTHYCRTVITNKCVDHWIHGNIAKKSVYRSFWMKTAPLNNEVWSLGPSMNAKRADFSCIESTNANLFAIGGQNANGQLNSIEFISTTNINSSLWSYTNANLTQPLSHTGCVIKCEYILIIAGERRYQYLLYRKSPYNQYHHKSSIFIKR